MNLGRLMAQEIAGGNVKVIHGDIVGYVDPYLEWLKWLSYEPQFQKDRIKELEDKENNTIDELNELFRYSYYRSMVDLFGKYGTGNIDKSEYTRVYDFMNTEHIIGTMISKLTSEELEEAEVKISGYKELSDKLLNEVVKDQQKNENFIGLSMVDSFVLHIISIINYNRNRNKNSLDREIDAQLTSNDMVRKRSIYNASKRH